MWAAIKIPQDRAGLVHFLEHMLFLGTEKYPEPGEYQSFISEHGGSHNAGTGLENTNYFFDIDAPILSRRWIALRSFFRRPTLMPSMWTASATPWSRSIG